MSILDNQEELISFKEASQYVENKYKGVEISTKGISSWANSPKYAKNLEVAFIGSLIYTSREAIDRFIKLGKGNHRSVIEDMKTIANATINNAE